MPCGRSPDVEWRTHLPPSRRGNLWLIPLNVVRIRRSRPRPIAVIECTEGGRVPQRLSPEGVTARFALSTGILAEVQDPGRAASEGVAGQRGGFELYELLALVQRCLVGGVHGAGSLGDESDDQPRYMGGSIRGGGVGGES